jgi:hypothetical protein
MFAVKYRSTPYELHYRGRLRTYTQTLG